MMTYVAPCVADIADMPRGGPDASWLDRLLQTSRPEYLDRDDVDEKDVLYLHDDSTKGYEVLNVENVEQRNLYLILKVRRVRPS